MAKIVSVLERNLSWLVPTAAGMLSLLLYGLTAAPWLTWSHDGADGGDLIAAAMTGGVPHPSGYPTYCLLARLFAALPLGAIARRFNLFSAAAAALTVAVVALCAREIVRRKALRLGRGEADAIAFITALAWAASPTLWSQAVITEVYTLAALFTALSLYLTLRGAESRRLSAWTATGLVFGLGLGAHLTLVLLLPALLLLLWPHRTRARLGAFTLGVACGAAVYLYLPIAAAQRPPVNWGDPRDWAGFWWVVSAKPYHGYLLGLPLAQLPTRVAAWMYRWGREFTALGLALAFFGLWSAVDERRKAWVWATGSIALLYSLYALTYDTTDSYVYLLPVYMVTALWMAEGVAALLAGVTQQAGRHSQRVKAAVLLSFLALSGWSLWQHYPTMSLRTDTVASTWTAQVLNRLPPGALLITGEDRQTFTMDYVLLVEGRRRDLVVVDADLLPYDWYRAELVTRYPLLQVPESGTVQSLVAGDLGQRPIYLSTEREDLAQAFQLEAVDGLLWRVVAAPR